MIDPVFRLKDNYKYPSDNNEIFEDYFNNHFIQNGEPRIYLPVAWSSYYRRAQYGKDHVMLNSLQKQLNRLDASKKYFTVITWDDGILNKVDHLDLQVFAACGNRIDTPIPLLCQPHRYRYNTKLKDIKCSFIGSLSHPIRRILVDQLKQLPGYYISTEAHHMARYCDILSRSKYVLCPRGYGQTSFRICEAIEYGAIPIYISDQFVYTSGCLVVPNDEYVISNIRMMVKDSARPSTKGIFTYSECMQYILKNIKP